MHNKQTQPILYVQVWQVLEWVKFEHNKLYQEPKNLGSDTNCNTPKWQQQVWRRYHATRQ
jgi:hypothetical protein